MPEQDARGGVVEPVEQGGHLVLGQRLSELRVVANVSEKDADGHDGSAFWRPFQAARTHVRCLVRGPVSHDPKWKGERAAVGGIAELATRPARREGKQPAQQPRRIGGDAVAAKDRGPLRAHRRGAADGL